MEFINDKDYESVSSTAIITSYPRIFTDIEKDRETFYYSSFDDVNFICKKKNSNNQK